MSCAVCDRCCKKLCLYDQARNMCPTCCIGDIDVSFRPNVDIPNTTLIGRVTGEDYFDIFDPDNVPDVLEASFITKYHVMTDADGNVVTNYVNYSFACPKNRAPVLTCGVFFIEDTQGDLARALAQPNFGKEIDPISGKKGYWKLF